MNGLPGMWLYIYESIISSNQTNIYFWDVLSSARVFVFMHVLNFTFHPIHTHTLTSLHLEVNHLDHRGCIAVLHSTTSDLEGPTGHGHDGSGSGCGRRRVRECKLLDDSRVIVMLQTPAGLGRPFGHGHGCIGSGRGRRVGIHFCVMDRIPGENFLYIVFEIAKYEPYVLCYIYCL